MSIFRFYNCLPSYKKNQKKLINGYRENLQTDGQSDNGHLIGPSVYGGPTISHCKAIHDL